MGGGSGDGVVWGDGEDRRGIPSTAKEILMNVVNSLYPIRRAPQQRPSHVHIRRLLSPSSNHTNGALFGAAGGAAGGAGGGAGGGRGGFAYGDVSGPFSVDDITSALLGGRMSVKDQGYTPGTEQEDWEDLGEKRVTVNMMIQFSVSIDYRY